MDWQTLSAFVIVAFAAGVLLRQWLRFMRGTARGGCGSCPSNNASSRVKSLPLVQIGGILNTPGKPSGKSNGSQH